MNTIAAAKPLLSDAPLGEVTVAGDALQIVFHRHLRAPVGKVWAALTTPERLADWFADAVVDLRVGGTISLGWNGQYKTNVRITVCDPPRSLAWVWGDRRPRHAGALRSRARAGRLSSDADAFRARPQGRSGLGRPCRLARAPRRLARGCRRPRHPPGR